tara:strand:- start:1531 stop:3282 length:1752 start_codon:yes stop_codon:yes gene_type:complete
MRKILSFIFLVPLLLLGDSVVFDSPFLTDSIRKNIDHLLDYEKISQRIKDKVDKTIFYQSVSFSLYRETLDLESKTKDIILEYAEIIKNLEERLDIDQTTISYGLGAPLIDVHFSRSSINKRNIRNNFHYNELESIKNQYLKLVRYHNRIISICENRISELLELLDKNSINKLYSDVVLEKKILVMSFTNISNIEKYDVLSMDLPDIIVNRYKDREDISVVYSGSIDPDLNKKKPLSENDQLLVDGSFLVNGYTIDINYKIYNIDNWTLYANESISCDIRDTECIYDGFLWSFENAIDPLIKGYPYDDFSNNDQKKILKESLDSLSKTKKNDDLFKVVLNDFVVQKDYSINLGYKNTNIDNSENRVSQEFNFENHPNSLNNVTALSDSLIRIISDHLKNPYDIKIGEIDMDFNKNDNSYVDLWVPVTFDVNEYNFEKKIKNFPYNSLNSRQDFNVYEFLYEDYIFQDNQIQSFNSYENEIFPVLFFADKDNNIQKILIDSWDSKYDHLLFGDYDVSRVEIFNQLFSVMESDNSLQLNMRKGSQMVNYKVIMPVTLLDNYTRLTIKVFTRFELDQYLPVSELSF